VILTKTKTKMPKQKQKHEFAHQPVLFQEVIDCLKPQAGESYLDLTAGFGGHSQAILEMTKAPSETVLVDRDSAAVTALSSKFKSSGAEVIHSDYLTALQRLNHQHRQFDMILADLGVSSPQFDEDERGFSFSRPGPLDMRMDRRQDSTADHLVNSLSEAELAQLLTEYGEEPRARAIARAIVASRPIKDTAQLANIIVKASGWRGRHKKINPATKSFQALRIAVNDELTQLKQSLPLILDVLAPGGRVAIISFHSLEDRYVKQFLREHGGNTYDSPLTVLTKKPLTASQDEIASNPRSRSAKLRAAAKIKT
jgi:16S rRNA (cytosine1402-N4)-methyltransferase